VTDDIEGGVLADQPVGGRRLPRTAAAILAVVVIALIALLATRTPSSERKTRSPLLGEIAPQTAGKTLDGDRVDIDSFRGRWVFVNFFASWCTPCQIEQPELQAFVREHQDKGDAQLIGVTYDNKASDARKFFQQRGGGWPVIDDPEDSIGVAYGVAKVPETFVISPDGVVVEHFPGGVTQKALDAVITHFEQAAAAG
jgi:cytochrome c biogenesis protein CcmG/thiol:disulfide interchange protein DsbE